MMRCKSVAIVAIVCISIAIGAVRLKRHQESAAINQATKDAARYIAKGDDSLMPRVGGKEELNDPPSARPAAEDEEPGGEQAELANVKETKPVTAAALLEENEKAITLETRMPEQEDSAQRQQELDQMRRSIRLPQPVQRLPEEHVTDRRRFYGKAAGVKKRARSAVDRRAADEARAAADLQMIRMLHKHGSSSNITEHEFADWFKQSEGIEDELELLLDREATVSRPSGGHRAKQFKAVQSQQRAQQLQDENELLLQHRKKCKCGGPVEGCCKNLACCWPAERELQQEGCCELGGFKL